MRKEIRGGLQNIQEKGKEVSLMIDINYARNQFEEYLNGYDRTDDKIHLKEVHTFCVVDAADAICRGEGLSEEDHQLALLIALLHDIGRFEQLKEFHSFNDALFDHAQFGVKVLFEDGMIRRFVKDDRYDSVIRKAIAFHSVFSLDQAGPLTEKEALHCRLIRDADKLDNFRVKATETLEAHFDVSKEEVQRETVSPNILEAVRAHRCIRREERSTHLDMWISYLAFIFDLNFPSSFRYIQDHDYINHNIDRMEYQQEKTKESMEEIRKICNDFVLAGQCIFC